MRLIDTHLHVVSPDRVAYPQRPLSSQQLANGAWWDGDATFGEPDAEAVLDTVQRSAVDGAMIVQAFGPYGGDNSYLFEKVGKHDVGKKVGVLITSVFDPLADSGADPALLFDGAPANHVATRLFHLPTPEEPWLDEPIGHRIVTAAADAGLVVVVCVQDHDLGRVERLVTRFPEVDFVLDHCGFADLTDPTNRRNPLHPLIERTNLNLKLTPTAVELCTSDHDGAAALGRLVATFGAERIVWGSDYPQHRTKPYDDQVAEIVGWAEPLEAADRQAVLGENAVRLWPAFGSIS